MKCDHCDRQMGDSAPCRGGIDAAQILEFWVPCDVCPPGRHSEAPCEPGVTPPARPPTQGAGLVGLHLVPQGSQEDGVALTSGVTLTPPPERAA